MDRKVHRVAIIGAGPAGIAAAIYLKRAGINPLLLERKKVGGLLANANLVENYPGFPDGICGGDLASLFNAQLRKWKIHVTKADVRRVSRELGLFQIFAGGSRYVSRFLILATGTQPTRIALPGLDKISKEKVLCEIADAPNDMKGKEFLIIGGGDAAFDYALNVARRGGSADLIIRNSSPTCIPLLLRRANKRMTIRMSLRTVPVSVIETRRQIELTCRRGGREEIHDGDYLLIACGREANLRLLSPKLRSEAAAGMDGPGLSNMHLAGDVKRGLHRQVGIAVGDGIAAAMQFARLLGKEAWDEDNR
jgi:thioredoxin reductase (NADPH)